MVPVRVVDVQRADGVGAGIRDGHKEEVTGGCDLTLILVAGTLLWSSGHDAPAWLA